MEKCLNPGHNTGPETGPELQCERGGLLWQMGATSWRPIRRPGPAVAAAHSARGVTATEVDAVARAATAHRRLAWCRIEGEGVRVVGGVCRARRETVRLTEEVGRR
jgi:hypothetical protein